MDIIKAELLAPAGSYDSLRAAINAGADAVYMGGSYFGARAYAENPDNEKLKDAIDYVHPVSYTQMTVPPIRQLNFTVDAVA